MWILVLSACISPSSRERVPSALVAPETTDTDAVAGYEPDTGALDDGIGSLVAIFHLSAATAWAEGGEPWEQQPSTPPLTGYMFAWFNVTPAAWAVGGLSPDNLHCWLSEPAVIAADEQVLWEVHEFPGDAEVAEDGHITCHMP